jgi:hypothetical protein
MAAVALPLCAGENAVLSNGFRIRADRHEVAGAEVRLISGDRVTVLPAGLVVRIEADEPPPVKESPVVPAPAAEPEAPSLPDLVRAAAERHGLPELPTAWPAESAYRADARPRAIGAAAHTGHGRALSADPGIPPKISKPEHAAGTARKYDGSANRALAATTPGRSQDNSTACPHRETQLYVTVCATTKQISGKVLSNARLSKVPSGSGRSRAV